MKSAPANKPHALALALMAALAGLAAPAVRAGEDGSAVASLDAGALDPAAALAQAAMAPQTLYLDIVLDGRVVRALVRFRREDGRLFVLPDELELAGLDLPPALPLDGEGRVALDAVPGLQVEYDQALQRVTLIPAAQLRPMQRLGYRRPGPVRAQRDHGLLLDWDAYARSFGGSRTLAVGSGLRWFGRFGTLEINGVSRFGDGGTDGWSRLDTTWSWSDPARMQTWSAGDVVSGGLGWSRPVRLGGVQWRRNFGVRPDLIVYPLPEFAGDATVPSSVELYVNNVRQYSREVDPGPFVINNFPRVVGSGQAVVVVTDALGRQTQTSVPLYVDYQRLAPGLSDFSIEAGVLRRGFGVDSTDYGNDLVASASWRRGLDDAVTIEAHGEVGPGLALAGAGFAWSPDTRFGVLTAAYAHSGGDSDGHQVDLGYQWFGQRMGFDLHARRASAGYRDLGTLDGGSLPLREQDRASLWFRVPHGSLSLSWLHYRDGRGFAGSDLDADVSSRVVSLGLSQSYKHFSLSASAFRDSRAGHGLSLSLSIPLGDDLHASLSADRGDDRTDVTASLRRSPPYAGGWGWQLQAGDDGDGQASARYRGGYGEVWVGVDRVAGRSGGFAQGNGSVVLMDGEVFASRRISDAFAVVSTNGVADVPILYENRVAGHTNDDGYLLLAELRGWQDNRVGIDPDGLPANLEVPAIERLVTPADHGGVRVEFALEPIRSAILVLHDADGEPVAAGTRVTRADGSQAIVGFGGELWLQDYVDGEMLRWTGEDRQCGAAAPRLPAGAVLPRLGPLLCEPGRKGP